MRCGGYQTWTVDLNLDIRNLTKQSAIFFILENELAIGYTCIKGRGVSAPLLLTLFLFLLNV